MGLWWSPIYLRTKMYTFDIFRWFFCARDDVFNDRIHLKKMSVITLFYVNSQAVQCTLYNNDVFSKVFSYNTTVF